MLVNRSELHRLYVAKGEERINVINDLINEGNAFKPIRKSSKTTFQFDYMFYLVQKGYVWINI